MQDSWIPWLLIGVGTFSLLGGALGWNWFLQSNKARLFMRLFGRNGTRVVYVLLGLTLVTLGVLALTGVIRGGE